MARRRRVGIRAGWARGAGGGMFSERVESWTVGVSLLKQGGEGERGMEGGLPIPVTVKAYGPTEMNYKISKHSK